MNNGPQITGRDLTDGRTARTLVLMTGRACGNDARDRTGYIGPLITTDHSNGPLITQISTDYA
ncbi:MAG: hypothetical protein LBK61_07770 [Spirochaetaceae bacterium]|nr:hypothetical protein [Spirochaetaceae bacterium]